MGPGGFFPTNPDLADILGRTDFDFENFYFLDFLGPKFLAWAQLGPTWAHLGPGLGPPTLGPAWAHLVVVEEGVALLFLLFVTVDDWPDVFDICLTFTFLIMETFSVTNIQNKTQIGL